MSFYKPFQYLAGEITGVCVTVIHWEKLFPGHTTPSPQIQIVF